ncbi:metallothionein [Pseudomonas sp. LD120]|uniref:metallothionein n=1 Tax=Pseudomonas sp. LD120 TaxID=485751 RepID=UPI00135B2308|nr:metallothionein [Pseudomonas sp. LD120]KAF0864264.1 metallothionein [Pseudomonas sp. LD120]
MSNETCACLACTCKLGGGHAIVRHGKHCCCQACADHHAHGEPCASTQGCKCAQGAHG